jgi:hypothetical protein
MIPSIKKGSGHLMLRTLFLLHWPRVVHRLKIIPPIVIAFDNKRSFIIQSNHCLNNQKIMNG